MSAIFDWIFVNGFELSAAALGLICIFLQIKQNAWYWGLSMVMVTMYIWVYFQTVLYADMLLQVYYLIVSVYGWWAWLSGAKAGQGRGKLPVTKTNAKTWLALSLVMLVAFVVLGFLLDEYTNSTVPWLDAFVTALSFAATWMLARKKIENWLVWIVADVISCYMYYIKEMYPTLVLFVVLSILAVVGFYQWKKDVGYDKA